MPDWSPEIEKWTLEQIRLNKWRFHRTEDTDDILQEAKLLFWQLQKRYPTAIRIPHFFTLYKNSLLRKFHDKARKMMRTVDETPTDDAGIFEQGGSVNCGALAVLLEEMPDELKLSLKFLTAEKVRLKLAKPTQKRRYRENHNLRLKRCLGLTSTDPVGDLKSYLSNI